MPTSPLWDLLPRHRPVEIVDVGANPVNGAPPYQALLDDSMAHVTGFEPEAKAFAALGPLNSETRRYLPYALGDGNEHALFVCWGDGMSSLLEPDVAHLELFNLFPEFGRVVDTVPVQTHRLDDIDEVDKVDFLKIDIQGGELAVFQNGRAKLADAVTVHTEVSFMTLYQDQPTFGNVDVELRNQGFVPHHFADPHSPWQRPSNENTNRLYREYLPKGTVIPDHQPYLTTIAEEINNRPRRRPGYLTPTEAFARLLAGEPHVASTP